MCANDFLTKVSLEFYHPIDLFDWVLMDYFLFIFCNMIFSILAMGFQTQLREKFLMDLLIKFYYS